MASWAPQTPQPSGKSTSAAASHKFAKCYFCGLENHPRKRCLAREAACSSCGKKGHFAKVCKSKPQAGSSSTTCETWGSPSCLPPSSLHAATTCETWGVTILPATIFLARRNNVRAMGAAILAPPPTAYDQTEHPTTPDQDSDSTLASVTIDQSAPHQLARSMLDILVEGRRTSSLFDTGSTESFIHPDTVQRCGLAIQPKINHWNHPTNLADVPGASAAPETCEEQ
ncbi:uncharacterized protein [Mobula birostris]|uniref:uncharacterized protein isoform X2 n=1 Tax=Mobula birostris TaxID=1983395 RepID=UPI003B28C5BD